MAPFPPTSIATESVGGLPFFGPFNLARVRGRSGGRRFARAPALDAGRVDEASLGRASSSQDILPQGPFVFGGFGAPIALLGRRRDRRAAHHHLERPRLPAELMGDGRPHAVDVALGQRWPERGR